MLPGEGEDAEKKFLPLSLSRLEPASPKASWKQPEDKEIFVQGHGKFFDDIRFVEGFEWPRTAYILILPDHVPAIVEGLRQGISSRPIVMRTLYNLMQLGEYEWAAQLLPLMPEHWEFENPVLIQIKAVAYFFAGDVEAVRKVLERGYVHNPDNPSILENMGKFFLLLKEKDKAQHYFQKALDYFGKEEEKAHIRTFLQVLEENGERWPTVSVCVICRDEPKALKSLAGLADETIVVDTGSRDRSREIAENSGARVFDYPWDEDFSKIRNFAMEKATSDYVFMLDADEYFSTLKLVEFHVLKRLLPLEGPRAFSLAVGHFRVETDWMNVLMGGDNFITETRAIRIFPNLNNLQYRGRFGESLLDALTRLNIPISDLPENQLWLQHDVQDRGRRLLRKMSAYEKETDPNLGQIVTAIRDLSYLGDKEGTIRWLKRLIDLGIKEEVPSIRGMGIRLACLVEGESQEKAQEIIEYLRKMLPGDKRLMLALSSHFIRNGLFSKLSDLDFGDIVEISKSGGPEEDMEYWIHGGAAALERGDIDSAAWILDQVLSRSPDNLLGQCARFFLLSRIGDLGSSASALEDILDITSGCTSTQVMTPLEFLKTVEDLSDTLGKWGHAVARSFLLHGALALKGQLEAT
jgi:tetratricopeptide (TPR) repeat protein